MQIDRSDLLNDLLDFVYRGNGVVTGQAGIGKSYLMARLRERLKADGIPHLLLAIDQLGRGTDDDLRTELSLDGDLIARLRETAKRQGERPRVLIFDAFDAARNEDTQHNFLRLIRRAVQELAGYWTVIVTVRTYDAAKSRTLLALFGKPLSADPARYQDADISCRHFSVPPLDSTEVAQAVAQIPHLEPIYHTASDDFKALLSTPFNLWLLERVLADDIDVPEVSRLRSEVQLLDLYWRRRVRQRSDADDRDILLTRVVREMVNAHSLSVRKDAVYAVGDQRVWAELLSDEVLAETSSTRQRVTFSHNMLFDYAVSVLLMDDEPNELSRFLSADPLRPLFLQPSLTYYFARLWYSAPEVFWRAFWHVLRSEDLPMRLIGRVVPAGVVVRETHHRSQLTPTIEALDRADVVAPEGVLRLLQALRALDIVRDAVWPPFLADVSSRLRREFAWDVATLTASILDRAVAAKDDGTIRTCGQVARHLLEWTWTRRAESRDPWIDAIGGTWAVPLVAKTFHTDPAASRRLLAGVLTLTKEPDFPIRYLYQLTAALDHIWPHDAEFAALVYLTVFVGHDEASDEKTYFGSPTLPLSSTRRQDYQMCQYLLVQHFPAFLRAAPSLAARACIWCLNDFIVDRHISPYLTPGQNLDTMLQEFSFRGASARYITDHSCIWDRDGHEYEDEPVQMATELFNYIDALASQETLIELEVLLDVLRDNVWMAFFWKRLLDVAVRHASVFAPRLVDLLLARPVQLGADTLYELGRFLELAAEFFNDDERRKIECSILTIGEGEPDGTRRAALLTIRDRLLARIPRDLLVTDEGRQARSGMEERDTVPKNEPLVAPTVVYGRPYGEAEWLAEQGVNLADPSNQEILNSVAALGKYVSEPNVLGDDEITATLPVVQDAIDIIDRTPHADQDVLDSAWTKLGAWAKAVAHTSSEPDSSAFHLCRTVLLRSATQAAPRPNLEYDAHYNAPGWSPAPRHEAAQGLSWLASRKYDRHIEDAIDALVHDPVPSVRYLMTYELFRVRKVDADFFWRLADDIADHEQNAVVLQSLAHSLGNVIAEDEDRTARAINSLFERARVQELDTDAVDMFVTLAMWLVLEREHPRAVAVADAFLAEPVRYALTLRHAASSVAGGVTPQRLASAETSATARRALAWLLRAIDAAAAGIADLQGHQGAELENLQTRFESLYGIMDDIVRNVYFAAGIRSTRQQPGEQVITDAQRSDYHVAVKPLLLSILTYVSQSSHGVMLARTAQYFMEYLNGVLAYDPRGVLHMATRVAIASRQAGYHLDAAAVREVVQIAEAILADHREEVRDESALHDLLMLLDLFAEVGWPEALRVIWKLDEVYR